MSLADTPDSAFFAQDLDHLVSMFREHVAQRLGIHRPWAQEVDAHPAAFDIEHPASDQGAQIARRLGSVEFVTCATPAYLAAREPLCHPSQLENTHPVVRYAFPSSGKHNRVEFVRGDEQTVIEGNYVVAVNDSNGYLAAGLAGLGVLHTLRFMVQPHLDSGELVPVLEDWSARQYPLGGVHAQSASERASPSICRLAGRILCDAPARDRLNDIGNTWPHVLPSYQSDQ